MYNIAISAVLSGLVFAGIYAWGGAIAAVIPAIVVFGAALFFLAQRTSKLVQAEIEAVVPLLQERKIEEAQARLNDIKTRHGRWQVMLEGQIDSQIGMIDYLQMKWDLALPKLEKGKWRNWTALTCIGCIQWRKNDKEAAYTTLEEAADAAGNEAIVYLVWATLLTRDGKRSEALTALDKGIKVMPESEQLKNLQKVVANKKKINIKVFPQTWYQFFPEEMAQQMIMRGRKDGKVPGMPTAPNQRISARRAPRR